MACGIHYTDAPACFTIHVPEDTHYKVHIILPVYDVGHLGNTVQSIGNPEVHEIVEARIQAPIRHESYELQDLIGFGGPTEISTDQYTSISQRVVSSNAPGIDIGLKGRIQRTILMYPEDAAYRLPIIHAAIATAKELSIGQCGETPQQAIGLPVYARSVQVALVAEPDKLVGPNKTPDAITEHVAAGDQHPAIFVDMIVATLACGEVGTQVRFVELTVNYSRRPYTA